MPHPHLQGLRPAALAVVLLALAAGPAASQARAASPPAPATASTAAIAAAGPVRASELLLITGDRLLVPPGSPSAALPEPAAAANGFVNINTGCGETFKVPQMALPYLGRGLDPSLFQPAAVARAESGGRLPVALSYHGPLPAVPGVTVIRSGGGTATGYLTAASARVFGAALHRQFLADHTKGSYGTDGLFGAGLSITLAGAETPARDPGAFPMHTLTVTGTDEAGKPDTGDAVLVFNLDDCRRLDLVSSFKIFDHGSAKLSVPAGHYWAIGVFIDTPTTRIVVLPQFTVTGQPTVHVRERAATGNIKVTTPRPLTDPAFTFDMLRSGHGFTEGAGFESQKMAISPVSQPPTVGGLRAFTTARSVSPHGNAPKYEYGLDFAAPPGTIPVPHYTAHSADLATVRQRYYQDSKLTVTIPPGYGFAAMGGGYPAELAADLGTVVHQELQRMPGTSPQMYLSAAPVAWRTYDDTWLVLGPGEQTSTWHLYPAAARVNENYNRYPLHLTPNAILPGAAVGPVLPTAARAGNTLRLDLRPFGDNRPGDTGSGFSSCIPHVCNKGAYALYQNGAKVISGDAGKAAGGQPDLRLHAHLSPKPSLVKLILTAHRHTDLYPLSATSTDIWTWRSQQPAPGAMVPAPWYCSATGSPTAPVYRRDCAVQPMTTLRYQLAGLSLEGVTKPGRQQVTIAATQIPLAPVVPITHASVQASFDGGRTWHPATVSATAPGHFRAVFRAPAGAMVTLRTHAWGAGRTSVTETILGAYRVSGH